MAPGRSPSQPRRAHHATTSPYLARLSIIFAFAALLVVPCASATSIRIRTSIPGLFTLSLEQASNNAPTIANLTLFKQDDHDITGFGIFQFQNSNCSNIGEIFNPTNYMGACSSDTNCAVGNLSALWGFDADAYAMPNFSNFTFNGVHTNLDLRGSQSVSGRSFGLYTDAGTVYCAAIGPAPVCPSTQFRTANQSATTAVQCEDLTYCNPVLQYQTVAATAISDRQCADYVSGSSAAVVIQGISKSELFYIEKSMQAALIEVLGNVLTGSLDVSFLRKLNIDGTNSTTPSQNAVLELHIAAANLSTMPPSQISQTAIVTALRTLRMDTNTSRCATTEQVQCACNTSAVVPTVAMVDAMTGCFDVDGDSYCVPADNACPSALFASTINSTRFTGNDLKFRACPRDFTADNCLEVALQANVSSVTNAPPDTTITLNFPPVPPPPNNAVNLSFIDIGVNTLRNGAEFFRNQMVQPRPFPYAAVNYQIQYMKTEGGFDMSKAQSDAISYFTPFAVVVAVSVLMLLFFPLVMCFVCCCRCCRCCCCHRCCGGRLSEETPPSKTKCMIFGFLTFLLAILLVAFGAMLIQADKQITGGKADVSAAAITGIDNLDLFKNNTFEQVEDIPDILFPEIKDAVFEILDNINAGVAFGIVDISDEITSNLIVQALAFADEVDENIEKIRDLIQLGNEITGNLTSLEGLISTLSTDHTSLINDCNTAAASGPADGGALQTICDNLPSFDVPTNFADSASDIFDGIESGLAAVQDINIRELAEEVTRLLNTLPQDIQNEINNIVGEIETQAADLEVTVDDEIDNIHDTADEVLYQDVNIDNQKVTVDEYSDMAATYDDYREQANLGLGLVYVAAGAIIMLGVIIGACAYNPSPADRTTASSMCGKCITFGIVIAISFTIILNLLLIVLFPMSAFVGKSCDSFENDGFVMEIVDNPANWDGYILDDLLRSFGNSSDNSGDDPITVKQVLDSCRANEAIYTALQLESVINITEYADVADRLNLTQQLNGLDFANYDVIPADLLDSILDYQDIGIQDVDTSVFLSEIEAFNSTLNSTELDLFYEVIRQAFDDYVTGGGTKDVSGLIATANTLDGDMDDVIALKDFVLNIQVNQLSEVDDLLVSVEDLVETVQEFAQEVIAFEEFFSAIIARSFDVDAITDDLLGLVDEFVDVVTELLEDDFAPCGLLTTTYDSMIQATCGEAFKGVDAYWFALALLVFSTFLLAIFGVKFTRFLRRDKEVQFFVVGGEKKPTKARQGNGKRERNEKAKKRAGGKGNSAAPKGRRESWEDSYNEELAIEMQQWDRPKKAPRAKSGSENFAHPRHAQHRPTSRLYDDGNPPPPLVGNPPGYYDHPEYDDQPF